MRSELIVDNFAGGGGASTGIEIAIGRAIDIAINHDPAAIAMYKANHPGTKIYCENAWEVDPIEATKGQPVALAWFSPDCKHFSKAKGGKPVEKKIRGLAWIVLKWAGKVHPRVIMLENVEEFVTWGPVRKGKPVKSKKGQTFHMWKLQLESLGYKVEHRELIACDYGAPTSRKRFFCIARCDGKPIVWPKPTHGDPDCLEVRCGLLKPWRTAAECIDWSIPCPSIFDRKKPLAENTLKRIARGIEKFVLSNPNPFIINYKFDNEPENIHKPLSTVTSVNGHYVVAPVVSQLGQTGGGDRLHDIQEPLSTIVSKAEHMLVMPTLMANNQNNIGGKVDDPLKTITTGNRHFLVAPQLIQYHSETAHSEHRGQSVVEPIMTLDGSNRYGLVAAFMSKYFAGGYTGAGAEVSKPTPTVTSIDHNALVTSQLLQLNNHCDGRSMNEPIPTIVAGPGHWGEVRAFLMAYYGNGEDVGQNLNEPLRTVVSKDRFGIVTIHGQDYQIVDIGMRMLEPRELYNAQGFPADYIIDRDYTGKPYPKTAQVARCGNSVPPPFSEALVRANLPELCDKKERQLSAM
jgi:DNA (cytosine-5)-methyltransferase 1